MAIRIQFRRGSAADWATANPVLAAGELGYESDTGQIKIGTGSTAWNVLSYGAVSEAYVNDAISNVVGLAPETLDTLNELANAIGNDPSFITSIASDISNAVTAHNGTTANVHGIANTLALETETGAQEKADLALGDAQSYTDTAIANLVESAPSTLNTLNELAAALGDDPNFATSIANTIGTKLTFVADTAENFATANAVTAANTIYIETNAAGYIKVGNGVAHYNSLGWVGQSYADIVVTAHNEPNSNAHGIADFTALALTSQVTTDIANAISENSSAITSEIANAITTSGIGITSEIANAISNHSDETANVHGIANTLALVADVESLQDTATSLQTQVDSKLGTTTAASTYAPLANPTFTGNVSLPSTTSIDGVSGTEIGYLNNVTSSIQTQLDAKAPTADPTFTGTVSGITKSMVGLNNVNNTADANKPVSTATQAALDLKADLSGGATFTGTIVLPSTTSIGNVSATELGYVDGVTSAIQTQLNTKAPTADPTFTGTLSAANVVLSGNLTVQGTTTTQNTNSVSVQDPLIYIGEGNTGNSVDLGFIGSFNNGTYQHAGFVRDHTDGKWKLFSGVIPEPGATVDLSGATYDTFKVGAIEATSATIGNVSNTEFQYLDGVTSAIQTQLNAKAPAATPSFTGGVTVDGSGVIFTDGTQTKAGVPSLTAFTYKTGSYTLDALTLRDGIIEVANASATTITIPLDSAVNYPVGTSIDILQTSTGQVTIAATGGVTVNATPGLKLRTQWSSATLLKRAANTWIVYGDLTA